MVVRECSIENIYYHVRESDLIIIELFARITAREGRPDWRGGSGEEGLGGAGQWAGRTIGPFRGKNVDTVRTIDDYPAGHLRHRHRRPSRFRDAAFPRDNVDGAKRTDRANTRKPGKVGNRKRADGKRRWPFLNERANERDADARSCARARSYFYGYAIKNIFFPARPTTSKSGVNVSGTRSQGRVDQEARLETNTSHVGSLSCRSISLLEYTRGPSDRLTFSEIPVRHPDGDAKSSCDDPWWFVNCNYKRT